MKKIIIATFAVALFSFSAKASSKNHKLFIPAVIESSFSENFPNVSDEFWSIDNQYMKASFVQDNVPVNAYFDTDGNLTGTTKAASFSDLPAKAQQHITTKYKDYTIGETILFIDNDAENESDIFRVPDSEAGYFVSLNNGKREIVLQVNKSGDTSFYEEKNL